MSFRIPALKELTDQQVRFAPAPKREEQLGRAIRLLGEIEPKRYYPYQFVCYRLTEYRPEI
ncbi:MAG: RNA polymerase subunit sigma-70, partial [Gemmataceae bacterium]|nr:RNA polymerase subunit sigma-70 [Gemmataceae bacterium]